MLSVLNAECVSASMLNNTCHVAMRDDNTAVCVRDGGNGGDYL